MAEHEQPGVLGEGVFPSPPVVSDRERASVRMLAVGASLLAVVFLVISTSLAAFTATTTNATNSLATGSVSLVDDDVGAAVFDGLTGLGPLDTIERCIHVDYTGSLDPIAVGLYTTSLSGGLAGYVDLTIEIGPGNADAFGSCASFSPTAVLYTGTLAGFDAAHDSYATAVTGWDPAGAGESRTYRFEATIQDDPGAGGLAATWTFAWETRSG